MSETLYHPLTIGSVSIPGNLFLAPLAGFTDKAYRSVCIRHGADLTFSEMVSAEGIFRGSEKTCALMDRGEDETLFAIQIFMYSPEQAERALPIVAARQPSIIDINCGCPVPKVVKTGAGSALMKHPEHLYSIVKVLCSGTDIPVTVKIRLGWDTDSINYLEVADAAIQGGASMLAMHARTRTQGYSGTADISHLAKLKQHVPIPVIGSGDLFFPQDAERMLSETGVDGVMFARGAIGNPSIFSSTRKLLETGEVPAAPSLEQQISFFMEHLELAVKDKGEAAACREMRKHAGSYIKGFPGASAIRREVVQASSVQEYKSILL